MEQIFKIRVYHNSTSAEEDGDILPANNIEEWVVSGAILEIVTENGRQLYITEG